MASRGVSRNLQPLRVSRTSLQLPTLKTGQQAVVDGASGRSPKYWAYLWNGYCQVQTAMTQISHGKLDHRTANLSARQEFRSR